MKGSAQRDKATARQVWKGVIEHTLLPIAPPAGSATSTRLDTSQKARGTNSKKASKIVLGVVKKKKSVHCFTRNVQRRTLRFDALQFDVALVKIRPAQGILTFHELVDDTTVMSLPAMCRAALS